MGFAGGVEIYGNGVLRGRTERAGRYLVMCLRRILSYCIDNVSVVFSSDKTVI